MLGFVFCSVVVVRICRIRHESVLLRPTPTPSGLKFQYLLGDEACNDVGCRWWLGDLCSLLLL